MIFRGVCYLSGVFGESDVFVPDALTSKTSEELKSDLINWVIFSHFTVLIFDGRASGATVRSGHARRVFLYSSVEKTMWIRIQTGLDTSRIRIKARLCCVCKRFPRGTQGTPLCGAPLKIVLEQGEKRILSQDLPECYS